MRSTRRTLWLTPSTRIPPCRCSATSWRDCPDGKWKGTATQLHKELTERIRKPEHDANEAHQKAVAARDPDLQALTKAKLREAQQAVRDVMSSGFPKKPNGLTHELRKAGPQLRKIGISITWPSNNRDRDLSIVWERPRTKYENSPSPVFPAFPNGSRIQ